MSMLTKEQIQKEIEAMDSWIPVSEIEKRMGMPPTTLQKVLKGTRELPKKWHKKLEAYFVVSSKPVTENNDVFKSPLTIDESLTAEAKSEIEEVKIADSRKFAAISVPKNEHITVAYGSIINTESKPPVTVQITPQEIYKPTPETEGKSELKEILNKPERLKGESSLDYKIRISELNGQ